VKLRDGLIKITKTTFMRASHWNMTWGQISRGLIVVTVLDCTTNQARISGDESDLNNKLGG